MRGIAFCFLILLTACNRGGIATPGSGQAGLGVAQAALSGGSPQIALQVANSIVSREPNNDEALIIQGESLTQLGRLDEAATSFSVVLQHDAESVAAHIGLGRVRLASDPASAELLFLGALQKEPRNAVALNDLGIARDLQGHYADAETAYRSAMAANPEMNAAQVNLALSLAMAGNARDAVQLLRPLASNPEASRQVRHDLAAVLAMGGNKAEAATILSKDLPPQDVQQALEGYAAGRPSTAASLLASGPPPNDVPVPSASSSASTQSTGKVAEPAPIAAPVQTSPSTQGSLPVQTSASLPPAEPAQKAAPGGSSPPGIPQAQLTAAVSEDAARALWRLLQERVPDAMDGHQAIIARVERDGHVFWRLRTSGFDDASQAAAFCERIRAAGSPCAIVR